MSSNTNNSNTDTTDLDIIDSDITKHRRRAMLLIILVGVLYLYLGSKELPESAQSWGTFGDFIGGILNPIFALFAFYWLTYSVRLQVKELKDTRKELQKAAQAQVETSIHQEKIAGLEEKNINTQNNILELQQENLKSQNLSLQVQKDTAEQQQKQIAIQNFESLFFQLLSTQTEALKDIYSQDKSLNSNEAKQFKGKDAIKRDISSFKSFNFDQDWEKFYQENLLHFWGSYFRVCYQIVKLIDQNPNLKLENADKYTEKPNPSLTQKKYFDIFRSTLTQYELEAFFFNCLCIYGAPKFKNLLTKYGLFEPLFLDYDRPLESCHRLTRYAYKYDSISFESNPIWRNYFHEISLIDFSFDNTVIIDAIEKLNSLFFIFRTSVSLSITDKTFINSPCSWILSPFLKEISIKDYLSTSTIRKIKRQHNSIYLKNTKLIKQHLESIKSSQITIKDIMEHNGPNIDNYTPYYPDDFTSIKTTINTHNQIIIENKRMIKELKNNILKLNNKLNLFINEPSILSTLILVKYGISYEEYKNYMTSKASDPE